MEPRSATPALISSRHQREYNLSGSGQNRVVGLQTVLGARANGMKTHSTSVAGSVHTDTKENTMADVELAEASSRGVQAKIDEAPSTVAAIEYTPLDNIGSVGNLGAGKFSLDSACN